MKKKVALSLAGFLRGKENIKQIKRFINKNEDYEFYNFVVVYDRMGTKTKAYQGGQDKTEIINLETFLSFKCEYIEILKYDEVIILIKKFMYNNLDKLDSILPFDMSKSENIIQLHNILCRWYMSNFSLKLINKSDIKFDYVIQTRFDLKSKSLEKIKDVGNNIVSIHFRNEDNMKILNNTIFKLNYEGVVADTFFYYNFIDLDKMIKITEIDYILSCLKNKNLKSDFKIVGDFIKTNEFILMMVLIINKFKFENLKSKPIVNRNKKYDKSIEIFNRYFDLNLYINWVNLELNKIPIFDKDNDKYFTLKYILDQITNKNYNGLEFGVFKGLTTNMISKHVKKLYGFDSFEGLPEAWDGVVGKGFFKIEGLPIVDSNVELIQGLFQDTLDNFLKNHPEDFKFIHIDCDLYSSTKYIFSKLIEYKKLKKGVIIVFDEILNYNKFLEGELKALYEINTQNGIKFEWIGTHGNIIFPKDLEDKNNKFNKWSFKQYRKKGYQQEAAIVII